MALVVRKQDCFKDNIWSQGEERQRERGDLSWLTLVCRISGRIWQLGKLIITEARVSEAFSNTLVSKTAGREDGFCSWNTAVMVNILMLQSLWKVL